MSDCYIVCAAAMSAGRFTPRGGDYIIAADAGVKQLIVIAQDITRYGTDLYGDHALARLLREMGY